MTYYLVLYLQKFPGDLLPSTYPNSDNLSEVKGRTEVERRGEYIELLESKLIPTGLVELVKLCLHNVPSERPSTEDLLTRLQAMRVEVEGDYGVSPIRLDMMRVRLVKELREKDRLSACSHII